MLHVRNASILYTMSAVCVLLGRVVTEKGDVTVL